MKNGTEHCLFNNIEFANIPQNETEYFNDSNDNPFIAIHKWEGKIDQINNEKINATLYSSDEKEFDELTFNMQEISNDDKSLLKIGALFNLYVGYSTKNGTRKKEKIYKFRRINFNNNIDRILDRLRENDLNSLIKEY